MACRYDGVDDSAERFTECRKERDDLTKMLCEVMTAIAEAVTYYDEPGYLSKEVLQWWKNHQKLDALRKRQEEIEAANAIKQAEEEIRLFATKIGVAKRKIAELKKAKT